jgi:L-threonylcarbamoyladenylate synthase
MTTNPAFRTEIRAYDEAAVTTAAQLILDGACVAVPTETVYGLAADATNGVAVAGIYAAKGRPSFNPLIVHVLDLAAAMQIGVFDDTARALAARYWPGPLTLVVPFKPESGITGIVTAGLKTIALRVSAHPVMRALQKACDRPLAAPSANASGGISPTCAAHVANSLDGRIAMIIDGGQTSIGLESTIVSGDGVGGLRLLRPGPIDMNLKITTSTAIEAPGQLASHYAPTKPLRLNAYSAREDEWLIGFGTIQGDFNLSQTGDPIEAAAALFAALHVADASAKPRIAVAPISNTGIGVAINDRLGRAAA